MRTDRIVLALFAVLALPGATGCKRLRNRGGRGAAAASVAGLPAPQTDQERTLYTLGSILGERVSEFNLTPHELAVVQRGMADQVNGGHLLVDRDVFGPRLRELARARQTARAEVTRREGAAYAERAAQESGAQRLSSGLVYKDLQVGTGAQPTASDEVTVHYVGTLINGTEFDSSRRRNEPATFPLNGVIPCWTEGVQRMHVGGRARLVCPADIAYGDRAQREIPAGSTLVFEVELLSIRSREQPSAAPSAATEPSAGASASPAH